MTRFLLKIFTISALIFAVLNITARTIGMTQPPNPALAGFSEGCEEKPQPCWYGIVPGVTTDEESDVDLAKFGFFQDKQASVTLEINLRKYCRSQGKIQCAYIGLNNKCKIENCEGGEVLNIRLDMTNDIELGDLIAEFGMPSYVAYFLPETITLYWENYYDATITKLTFYQRVNFNFSSLTGVANGVSLYRNLIPLWRYCQLEKPVSSCNT